MVDDEVEEELMARKFGTVGCRRGHLPMPSFGFNFLTEMGVEDCNGGA